MAAILTAVSLLLYGTFTLIIGGVASKLESQQVVSRWVSDDSKYAQLSAFLSPLAKKSGDDIDGSLASAIDSAMVAASISPADEDARLYAYAYSGEADVTLSMRSPETGMTMKSGVKATALGVGADFFLFHPLKMLSGQYFNAAERVLNDQVIIDNDLAWQFFGSPDVVGRELLIGKKSVYIAGVCEVDGDYAEFYGEQPRIFMSYSLLSTLKSDLCVTAVEVVMPDPVTDFASGILEDNIGVSEAYVEIVENSARFTDSSLRARLGDFAGRSVRTKLVVYPYWENTAVKLTDAAALLYIGKLVPLVVVIGLLVIEVVLIYVKRRAIAEAIAERVRRAWRSHQQNKRHKPPKLPKARRTKALKAKKSAPQLDEPKVQPMQTPSAQEKDGHKG